MRGCAGVKRSCFISIIDSLLGSSSSGRAVRAIPALARPRRLRGVTLSRLTGFRPLPLPCGNPLPRDRSNRLLDITASSNCSNCPRRGREISNFRGKNRIPIHVRAQLQTRRWHLRNRYPKHWYQWYRRARKRTSNARARRSKTHLNNQ